MVYFGLICCLELLGKCYALGIPRVLSTLNVEQMCVFDWVLSCNGYVGFINSLLDKGVVIYSLLQMLYFCLLNNMANFIVLCIVSAAYTF